MDPLTFIVFFLHDIARTAEIHTKTTQMHPKKASGAPNSTLRTRPSLYNNKGVIGASWATWALPASLCDLLGLPVASWAILGPPVSTWAILGSNLIVFVRISAVLAMLHQTKH